MSTSFRIRGLYFPINRIAEKVGNINPDGVGRSIQLVLLQEHLPGFQYRLPHRRRCHQRNEPICHRRGSDPNPCNSAIRNTAAVLLLSGRQQFQRNAAQVDPSLGAHPNGEITVYHDGIILPGVVASTGERNTYHFRQAITTTGPAIGEPGRTADIPPLGIRQFRMSKLH